MRCGNADDADSWSDCGSDEDVHGCGSDSDGALGIDCDLIYEEIDKSVKTHSFQSTHKWPVHTSPSCSQITGLSGSDARGIRVIFGVGIS